HAPGASVGPTLKRIMADQFTRLRDGDRFWYENTFTGPQLAQLRTTHLADVIMRNTNLTTVQKNPFVFQVGISDGVRRPEPRRAPATGRAGRRGADGAGDRRRFRRGGGDGHDRRGRPLPDRGAGRAADRAVHG